MPREKTVAIRTRCKNTFCDRDAVVGCGGYCNPDYQAVRRRIRQGKYTEEELEARGKLERAPIDVYLKS